MRRWSMAGLALGLAACGPSSEVRHWVADRGAGEVVALDAGLHAVGRIRVPSPSALCASPGALWLLSGPSSGPRGALLRVDLSTGHGASTGLASIEGWALLGESELLALERVRGGCLLWRLDAALGRTLLGEFPAAAALAVREREALLAGPGGTLLWIDGDGARLGSRALAEPVLALAPGPRAGRWWVLAGGEMRWIGLLGADLEVLWSAGVRGSSTRFAPVPGAERIWIVAEGVLQRFGPGGALELELALPPGPWQTAESSGGALLLTSAGAVLEVRASGGRAFLARSQGGFRAVSAAASLRSEGGT